MCENHFPRDASNRINSYKSKTYIIHWQKNPQPYLTNPKFNNEMCSLLLNLMCESNQFKNNFHSVYGKSSLCKCEHAINAQSHALACDIIKKKLTKNELDMLNNIKYSDLHGSED